METLYDVVAIGNAVVDVLSSVSNGFLEERNLSKGGMVLVEAAEAGKIYNDLIPEGQVSGGSAANTIAAIASLGGTPAFIGKIHDDELGNIFKRDIGSAGIDFFTAPLEQGPSTARSLVLVTPDAQRSMFTYLGASKKLSVSDIDENIIKSAKIVYMEAYLWDGQSAQRAMVKACKLAKKHKIRVAFSLSDKECVLRHQQEFTKLIKRYVDILFANEEEITTLYRENDIFKVLDIVKNECEIAAVTRGEMGSVVVNGKVKTFVEAEKVKEVVDSTGAGDAYAAGFLFGLNNRRSLGTCALIGGFAAAEILSHYGARPEASLRGFVRNKMRQIGKDF
ncbi:MAG: adenosine kinase [Lactobacillaceae bacterium]|jgi:sugar/nucleoside kinase (ribokinase family)|nr:adenosine kinase [Lactobacillaceae bacterium]